MSEDLSQEDPVTQTSGLFSREREKTHTRKESP